MGSETARRAETLTPAVLLVEEVLKRTRVPSIPKRSVRVFQLQCSGITL